MKQPVMDDTPENLVAGGVMTPGTLPAGNPLSPTLPVLRPDDAGRVSTIEGTDAQPHNEHDPFGEAITGAQGAGLPLFPDGTDPAGAAPLIAVNATITEYHPDLEPQPSPRAVKGQDLVVAGLIGIALLVLLGRR